MIREIVRPQNANIVIDIPQSYIGKEVEYIVFPIEIENEINYKAPQKKQLRGIFNQYKDNLKVELENEAWKLKIQKKYKIND